MLRYAGNKAASRRFRNNKIASREKKGEKPGVTLEEQTRQLLSTALETRGNQSKIAHALEVNPTTVMRWKTGGEIPPPMVKLLRLYLLGEIPFEMVHPRQDLKSVLKFTADEWRVIETLAMRGGITAGEWIRDHVRNYLAFLDNTGGVKFPTGKPQLRVADEPAEAKKKPSA